MASLKITEINKDLPRLNQWIAETEGKVASVIKKTATFLRSGDFEFPAVETPGAVTGFNAIADSVLVNADLKSRITVSFFTPDPLGVFGGIQIYGVGYQGSATPTVLFEMDSTVLGATVATFILERTLETVTLYCVSKGTNGTASTYVPTTAPSASVTLGTLPPNVTTPSVSEDGIMVDRHHRSRVTVSWTVPTDINFGGVTIYTKGYAGGTEWVRWWVKPKEFSSIKETFEKTGETVYFAFVSFDRLGAENPFVGSPGADESISAVFNGNDSAPNVPQNFSGQAVAARGNIVVLTWDENIEDDIGFYEVARRTDATAPVAADIVAAVPAAGQSATKKAQWTDAPGAGANNYRYYVRAADKGDNRSAFTAAAMVTALAPDGTTDYGVPDAVYAFYDGNASNYVFPFVLEPTIPQNGRLLIRADSTTASPPPVYPTNNPVGLVTKASTAVALGALYDAPTNVAGIFFLHVKVYVGTIERKFLFADDGKILTPYSSDRNKYFPIEWPNAGVTAVEVWFENYFGEGVHYTKTVSPAFDLGSRADDVRIPGAPRFNPDIPEYSMVRGLAPATYDLTLDAPSGKQIKPLKTVNITPATSTDVLQVAGAQILDNSGMIADAKIPSLDASKTGSGTFSVDRIPNLNASKITAGQLIKAQGGTGKDLSSSGLLEVPVGDKKLTFGSAQFASGAKNLTAANVGLADIEAFMPQLIFGTNPTQYVAFIINGGGTDVDVYSSNSGSSDFFFYLAIGT